VMAGNALAHSSTVPAAAKVAGLVFMVPVFARPSLKVQLQKL
jgi:hypothetical protein